MARAAWILADIAVVLAYTGWLGVITGIVAVCLAGSRSRTEHGRAAIIVGVVAIAGGLLWAAIWSG